MASLHRKIHNRPTFSTNTPHFLKIISKGTCRQSKLGIPNKFLMKYGDDLSNPVFLKLPSGSEWKIELRRWEDKAWLDKGWPKFSKFYSLDYCHSLVFGYEGKSKFCVRIFDRNFTEIAYPLKTPDMKDTDEVDDSEYDDDFSDDSESESDFSDDSVEILDKFLPRSRKSSSSGKSEFPAKRHCGGTSTTRRFIKRTRSAKFIALQRAKAFKSDKPSFIVPMTRSYTNRSFVWLPSDFSFHMTRLSKNSGNVMFRVLDGRTWCLGLKCERAKPKARFQSGWFKFARDNNLKIGDVCVFVLVDDIRLTFEVVIFRATEAANTLSPDVDEEQTMSEMEETDEDYDSVELLDYFPPCPKTRKKSPIAPQPSKKNRTCSISTAENNIRSVGGSSRSQKFLKRRPRVPRMMNPVTESGTDRALQRAKAFRSEYPSSTVVMHPSYIRAGYLHIGAKFIKEHLLNRSHENAILRVSDGRTWPVSLGKQGKGIVRFQTGWMKFVQDNQLEIGDVCVFVLTNAIKRLIDVVLFRATEAAKCTLSGEGHRRRTISSSRKIKREA
ncbi:hypothetical protein L3X38_016573 [Prunus dulcis]|uniref:TF-B3 domain-containing protein n=1 Tax=Prunus dulcis TaxID=3755 RepID=A0AAD4W7H5_PRUDU|nr:hypothetical protein L3X38_016573 [Prunus dulcis]